MGGGRLAPQERLPNLTRNQLKLRVQGSGVRPTWLSRPPLEGRAVTGSKVLFISSHSLVCLASQRWKAVSGAQVSRSSAESRGVYSRREAGLLISRRPAAKAKLGFAELWTSGSCSHPIATWQAQGCGAVYACFQNRRTPGPVRLGESLGWGGTQGERRQLTCREGSFSEPLGLTSGSPS